MKNHHEKITIKITIFLGHLSSFPELPLLISRKTMELNIVGTFLIASKAAALMAASQMDFVEFLGPFHDLFPAPPYLSHPL